MARRRSRNVDIELLENPFNPWYGEPIRHSRAAKKGHRRNPVKALTMKSVTESATDIEGIAGAVGGFAAASMIPSMIIRPVATPSITENLLATGIALLSALGASYIGSQISAKAGTAALYGGFAGVGAQILSMINPNWKIIDLTPPALTQSLRAGTPSRGGISAFQPITPRPRIY